MALSSVTRGVCHALSRVAAATVGRVLDTLYPKLCYTCGCRLEEGERYVCTPCYGSWPRPRYTDIHNNALARRFWHVMPIDSAATAFIYVSHGPISLAVWAMKYMHNAGVARFLGQAMVEEPLVAEVLRDVDVLVPMPISKDRRRERGYNQSELLCSAISHETGIPVVADVLLRVFSQGSQTHKNARERAENVSGAFTLRDATALANSHVALVDDVITTGATMAECLSQLKDIPGIKVSVVALAQTEWDEM